jgi:hypothetical protein
MNGGSLVDSRTAVDVAETYACQLVINSKYRIRFIVTR